MTAPDSTASNNVLANPRGVLRPRLDPGQFQHHRQSPAPPLAGLIEHYWQASWDLRGLPPRQQATLPHPNVHLVVEQGQARIYGVHGDRFVRQLEGQDHVFGVKFKAGGFYPFYCQPVVSLFDRSTDVSACFGTGSADFAARVLGAPHFEDMCAVADTFLLDHLPRADAWVARLSGLLARIAQDTGITQVEHVVAMTGLSKRSLQRQFKKYVGVGPKWVIQRYRLHEVLAQIQAGKALNWADLAMELGYFDQAHLTRDFRRLVGMTPRAYEISLL